MHRQQPVHGQRHVSGRRLPERRSKIVRKWAALRLDFGDRRLHLRCDVVPQRLLLGHDLSDGHRGGDVRRRR